MLNKISIDNITQSAQHDRIQTDNQEEGEEVTQDEEASLELKKPKSFANWKLSNQILPGILGSVLGLNRTHIGTENIHMRNSLRKGDK